MISLSYRVALKFPEMIAKSNRPIPAPINSPLSQSGNAKKREKIRERATTNMPIDSNMRVFIKVNFFIWFN